MLGQFKSSYSVSILAILDSSHQCTVQLVYTLPALLVGMKQDLTVFSFLCFPRGNELRPFSCDHSSCVYLSCRDVCSGLYNTGVICCCVVGSYLCIFDIDISSDLWFAYVFCALLFCFIDSGLWCTEKSSFWWSLIYLIFFLLLFLLWASCPGNHGQSKCHENFPLCFDVVINICVYRHTCMYIFHSVGISWLWPWYSCVVTTTRIVAILFLAQGSAGCVANLCWACLPYMWVHSSYSP